MESQLVTLNVLNSILATLNRLETHIDGHADHLVSLKLAALAESSDSPVETPTSPRYPYASLTKGRLQDPVEVAGTSPKDINASSYLLSVLKLRNTLEFDSRSDLGETLASIEGDQHSIHGADDDIECRSMSMYSSRPLSRLELDVPPVPCLPLNIQKPTPISAINHSSNDEELDIIGYRYENRPILSTSAGSTASESSRLSTESQRTTSTAGTSLVQSPVDEDTGSLGQLRKDVPLGLKGGLKQSLRRSFSLRPRRSHVAESESPIDEQLLEQQAQDTTSEGIVTPKAIPTKSTRHPINLAQNIKKGAKACALVVPNMVMWAARSAINHQMKKLDAKT